jgi:O-antigen/teichoic acid export membrane protein
MLEAAIRKVRYRLRERPAGAALADAAEGTASLWIATLVGGSLGLALWWPAARMLAPADLALQWTVVNLATLIGALSTLGSGAALIRYLPSSQPRERACELRGAVAITVGAGIIFGAAALAVMPALTPGAPGFTRPLVAILFWLDVLATALAQVADEAALAFRRSPVIVERSLLLGVGRLAVVAPLLASGSGWALLVSDSIATAASACYIWIRLLAKERHALEPSVRGLRLRFRFAISSWLAGVMLVLPAQVMPAVLAYSLGPAQAGSIAPAWLIISYSRAVPIAMAAAVYAAAARREAGSTSLSTAALVGAPVAAAAGGAITIGGLVAFRLLGQAYRASAGLLWWLPTLLALWYLVGLLLVQARLDGRPWRALPAGVALAAISIGGAPAFLAASSTHGAGAAYAAGLAAAAAVGLATVPSGASVQGRHQPASTAIDAPRRLSEEPSEEHDRRALG